HRASRGNGAASLRSLGAAGRLITYFVLVDTPQHPSRTNEKGRKRRTVSVRKWQEIQILSWDEKNASTQGKRSGSHLGSREQAGGRGDQRYSCQSNFSRWSDNREVF